MTLFRNLKRMPGNVRYYMLAVALWGIPNGLIASYATLYMLEQGLTASQVGLINSGTFVVKTILSFFAGYVINRFGRRWTAGIIDLVGWGVYMLMLSFAKDFPMFLAAALLNCVTTVGGVATSCFMSEDISAQDRIMANTYSAIVTSSCSFIVPLSGFLIDRCGLVPAMRGLYVFACVSMSVSAFCKLFLLKETEIGKSLMAKGKSLKNPFAQLPVVVRYIMQNRKLKLLLFMNVLLQFATNIQNLYYVPYLTRQLGFSELAVSFFPFISTIIGLASCFFIVSKINMVKGILICIVFNVVGTFSLLAAAFSFNEIAFVNVALNAISVAMRPPLLNTLIANNMKDELRTDVYGFLNTFSMLCMFPAGYLGGSLFDISPIYLMLLVFGITMVELYVFATGSKKVGL